MEILGNNVSLTTPVDQVASGGAGGNPGIKAPAHLNYNKNEESANFSGGKLNSSVDELFSVLPTQDQESINNNNISGVDIWLEVKASKANNVSAENISKIQNAAPAGYIIPSNGYMDINLWLKYKDEPPMAVPNLTGKVSITVKVPTDLQRSGRTYTIIRLHDGVAEPLATTQDSNYNLTFNTDGFSPYAIAYSDNVAPSPATDITSPKTGEASNNHLILLICLATLSLIGLGAWRKKA